jgi:hypothetical protein
MFPIFLYEPLYPINFISAKATTCPQVDIEEQGNTGVYKGGDTTDRKRAQFHCYPPPKKFFCWFTHPRLNRNVLVQAASREPAQIIWRIGKT